MKRLIVLISVFLIALKPQGNAQADNVRYEVLLNSNMLADSLKDISFPVCFDVSPERLLTLSDGSLIYLLGWGGITTIGNKSNQKISSFAYSSDGLLLAVAGNELCYLSSDGSWRPLVRLPASQMSISAGKDVMYVYDHTPNKGKFYAYAIAKGAKYRNLFTSPKPINGIAELGDSICIAIESGIYSYSPQTKRLKSVFALEKGNTITSLAFDPGQQILYFSTSAAIYAFKSSSLVRFTDDFPGSIIKYSGIGLLIFNPLKGDILHIVNVDESIEF